LPEQTQVRVLGVGFAARRHVFESPLQDESPANEVFLGRGSSA
jgi:hypothetical protein